MSQTHRYRNLLSRLRPLLPDYLRGHGIELDSKDAFCCINPSHQDKNPSCHLIPDSGRERYKCFACGSSGDIFQAAHILEGRPITSKAFLEENVFALAKQFSIEFEEFQVEESTLKESEISRAYALAGSVLSASPIEEPLKETYNWTLEQVRAVEPLIGTMDWKDFTKAMEDLGDYSSSYLKSIGLNNKLFHKHLLTFGIQNTRGRLVGFAARDTRPKKSNAQKKWYTTSSADAPIFQKGRLLYGLYVARHEKGPLHMVEGFADCLALRMAGQKRVVAYMGSQLTSGQADRLAQHNCKDLILVPDWDENGAGEDATENSLSNTLSGREEFTIRVKTIPGKEDVKSYDPKDYVTEHGLQSYLSLPDVDAFEWRLHRLPDELEPEEKCEKIFPMIVAELRAIRQDQMLQRLAAETGVRLKSLRDDLDRLGEEKRRNVRKKLRQEADSIAHKVETTEPKDLPEVLRAAALKMEEIQDISFDSDLHGPEEAVRFVHDLQQEFWSQGKELPGWETGLTCIDEAFGGIPHKEAWIGVGGDGNVGKSALVQNIGLQVALRNPDAAVLLYTIDDTRSQTIPRLVSQMTGLKIKWVCQPQRYSEITEEHNADMHKAWGQLRTLIQEGRLDIKDASQGATLSFAEEWIAAVQNTHPGRPILFVLDNFHRLQGSGKAKEDRERIESHSSQCGLLAKQKGITIISTMELRKRENNLKRPTIADLKGTKQLEYDLTACMMLHSEMHVRPDKIKEVEGWEDTDGVKKPVLQVWIDKNKISSVKGGVKLKFRPDTCQMMNYEEVEETVGYGTITD